MFLFLFNVCRREKGDTRKVKGDFLHWISYVLTLERRKLNSQTKEGKNRKKRRGKKKIKRQTKALESKKKIYI